MKKHVTDEVLKWLEGTTSHRGQIEKHLAECSSCRKYYEWMAEALEPSRDRIEEPGLTPDPYLPSRIASLAGEQPPTKPLRRAFHWSLASFAFLTSITIGILLGKGLFDPAAQATTEDLINTYHFALLQQNFSAALDTVVQSSQGENR